jgi:ribosomal protein L19
MLYCITDMESVIRDIENSFKKAAVVDVRSGDTVRVHQRIREGSKERVQLFQGLVIRDVAAEAEEEKLKEEAAKAAEAEAAKKATEDAEREAKAAEVIARHEEAQQ